MNQKEEERNMKEQPQIPWAESVWFFDIDDTLIDTAGTSSSATEGIRKALEEHFSSAEARQVQKQFNGIFNLMLAGYRVKNDDWSVVPGGKKAFDGLLEEIESCQTLVRQEYGAIKKWSREVFIKLAADRVGISVTPTMVHEAADGYWMALTEQTVVFPHVTELFQEIKRHGRPIVLITSSDARLKMRKDGQFEYIPRRSERLKSERIELLRQKGIEFDGLSVGDPEDKPHPDFFKKGLQVAKQVLGSPINTKMAVMVGDSFGGDLQTPKEKMDFGLIVLFEKERKSLEIVDDRQINTGNLAEVTQFLSE